MYISAGPAPSPLLGHSFRPVGSRPRKMYTEQDRILAVELVHNGSAIGRAGARSGVPKTSLIRFLRACHAHSGPCRGALFRDGVVWHTNI